ncbi:MAG: Dabb family protein [Rhodobacteraceae bacterium]|nr:Dabb family protein [Paracoccaceae bacterium]
MLKHCVFLNFKNDVSDDEKEAIMAGLARLVGVADGLIDMTFGPNLDFEKKTPDFDYGFIVKFRDRKAHLAYETHQSHVEMGGRLVAGCYGGVEGIVVFDVDVDSAAKPGASIIAADDGQNPSD